MAYIINFPFAKEGAKIKFDIYYIPILSLRMFNYIVLVHLSTHKSFWVYGSDFPP